MGIDGIGKVKQAKYGSAVLKIIEQYEAEKIEPQSEQLQRS